MMPGKFWLASLAVLVSSVANAELTWFEVFPAYAPSGSGPGWDGWVTQAHAGIDADGAPVGGDRNLDPTAYEPTGGSALPHELIVTNFNSWRGKAAPSPFPSSAVSGEFGNRIHFGTKISSTSDMPFSLQDISWELDSTDSDDFFDDRGDFSTANYSPTRIGTNFGPDNALGGGDDIVYDDGEDGGLPIHHFSYVGVGTAFDGSSDGTITDQEAVFDVLRSILAGCNAECDIDLSGRYEIDNSVFNREVIRSADVKINVLPGLGGDFNLDGVLDLLDINLLTEQTAAGTNDILFDVSGDKNNVDFTDIEVWVNDLRHTYFGDANVDGEFGSGDLIQVFQSAKYETGQPANWGQGDWNGDGFFTSTDLVVAFIQGGYEKGPRWVATQAVPEPASIMLLVVGCLAAAGLRRHR